MIKGIIFFALIIFLATGEKSSPTIVAGVGTDSLFIGKTKITDVFKRYGRKYDFNMSVVRGTDFAMHVNRYYYRQQDLIFMTNDFDPKGEDTLNAVISDITFGAKSGACTRDKISIGVDSLGQVKSFYGKPEKIQESGNDRTFIYTKKGISFTGNIAKNFVYEIEVFRPGMFGSHY